MPLRVVMIARPNLYTVPGGDTVQIHETAKALHALGVVADIVLSGKVSYDQYDLMHFFNIIDPEDILGHILKSSLPFVVSTIYVDYGEYDREHRKGFTGVLSNMLPRDTIEYLKTAAKFVMKQESVSTHRFFLIGHRKSIIYILKHAGILLPNSENEYRRLVKDYGIKQAYAIVPNAIDPTVFQQENTIATTDRDIVLCVARLEGRKNQLAVIRALKDTELKIVFIGADSPNQKRYSDQCRREATGNMQFIPHLPQEELLRYYQRAKVHILASWFETTGLSSLEAGAMGCNLVVGARGDVADYFGNLVEYCDPGSEASIRKAVLDAWNKPLSEVLKQHIFNNFTWDRAARATLSAYKTILNNDTI